MKSARQVAFEALLKIQKDGAYSNLAVDNCLKENSHLDERDKSFVCNLVYGSLDRMILIDYNLDKYLNQPVGKLKPELHTILVLGAYQILFLDKVPNSAAVNESVELAKKNKSNFAASLVNAVLRRISDNGLQLPPSTDDDSEYLSVKYSCPEWLINLWIESYGLDNACKIAESSLEKAPITIRANTLKITADNLIWKLAEEGVVSHKSDSISDALMIENTGSVDELDAYAQGLFHNQDLASQYCVKALDPQEGEVIFDVCSAPGGKSFTIAETMKNTGTIRSFDIYQSRVELIKSGAQRLGITNLYAYLSDATIYNENYGKADKVLCDVPCSGLGVIRRKPEIRFKNKKEIDTLPAVQYKILQTCSKYVKQGGRLIYSTCTLNPNENENVVDLFLKNNKDFKSIEIYKDMPKYKESDYITLMPHLHNTDGFFIACLEKIGE